MSSFRTANRHVRNEILTKLTGFVVDNACSFRASCRNGIIHKNKWRRNLNRYNALENGACFKTHYLVQNTHSTDATLLCTCKIQQKGDNTVGSAEVPSGYYLALFDNGSPMVGTMVGTMIGTMTIPQWLVGSWICETFFSLNHFVSCTEQHEGNNGSQKLQHLNKRFELQVVMY